jgi:cysteinyl-tRNA synthetase
MALKIYNTLTKKKEVFKPMKNKKVHIFVCGPTVYDLMHIGHAKTYIQFDVIVKYLRYKSYKVSYLQNITDLDDKIIEKAKKEKTEPQKLARQFEKYYHQDEQALRIDSVSRYARATAYIKQIVKQIEALIDKGCAYKTSDGYYFDIKKFKDYGKLSRRTVTGAEDAVSRIDEGIEKRNKGDFCLWKISRPSEPSWKTKLGKGRPGWHIEDTAITETHFGPQYDIHGGARDLIFPHHEAEIAQMESASGKKPLVRYWLHTGFLNVRGRKMSKSLGNLITVKDALKKYDYRVLRFFYIASHYRSPINFTEKSLEKAKNSLERLNDFVKATKSGKDDLKLLKQLKEKFIKAMDDDFDTVKALATIFDFIKKSYKNNTGGKKAYDFLIEFDKIFGILDLKQEKIPAQIKKLIAQREQARKQKNFQKSDQLRQKIKKLGYWVEDTAKGPKVKKF